MKPVDETLVALADPARRGVIDVLRGRPRRASEIADALRMSRPAMSRHLRVLRRSGLITPDGIEGDARVRMYRLRREPFAHLRDWLSEVEGFWAAELDAFKSHLERPRPKSRSKPAVAKVTRRAKASR